MVEAERIILHCDLNNFYASVECALNNDLKGVPMAVCGSQEERHGIVLAKNDLAKAMGVRTGETIWQAKRKCGGMITVAPHFDEYYKYSRWARAIYARYTDQIEPFGIDECWLDVTGSTALFGSGEEIAERIRKEVREELGVTISVGLSFNKVFAKLGSDLKKPDAMTVITRQNYREIIWPLPADQMLGVGRSTMQTLSALGVSTIGELAQIDVAILRKKLGKNGGLLWTYANAMDSSAVARLNVSDQAKSVGNSLTCSRDLETPQEVWQLLLLLAESVSHRLREQKLMASAVVVGIKDNEFGYCEHTQRLDTVCRGALDMASAAMRAFEASYTWKKKIRAVGIRAIGLELEEQMEQISLFADDGAVQRRELIETQVDGLRGRFGADIIKRATLMNPTQDVKHHGTDDAPMPTFNSK